MSGTKNICSHVADFVGYANCHFLLPEEDNVFAFNRLVSMLSVDDCVLDGFPDPDSFSKTNPEDILSPLLEFALKKKLTTQKELDHFECEMLNIVLPPPSIFCERFDTIASQKGTKAACDFFYTFCLKSNYIKRKSIFDNINWTKHGEKGNIIISINAVRSEKPDSKTAYPDCPLCKENIGLGLNKANPRQTLRYISIILGGECWLMQYSPFCYYTEHCNIISQSHTPIRIDKECLDRMLEFLEMFPHYFVGSNSELPLVGASNPHHNHYQSGRTDLPVFDAATKLRLSSAEFQRVRISVPDWYSSVVRLESKDGDQLAALAEKIITAFEGFSDEKTALVAATKKGKELIRHNTVAPLARVNSDNEYSLDLIFRNNRTDDTHPLGVFGVPSELSCIKTTSLGLLEMAGLFILPARIASDSEQIVELLSGEAELCLKDIAKPSHPLSAYFPMIAQLANDVGTNCDTDSAAAAVQNYLNNACEKMLSLSAVFPETPDGKKSLTKFCKLVGLTIID